MPWLVTSPNENGETHVIPADENHTSWMGCPCNPQRSKLDASTIIHNSWDSIAAKLVVVGEVKQ